MYMHVNCGVNMEHVQMSKYETIQLSHKLPSAVRSKVMEGSPGL